MSHGVESTPKHIIHIFILLMRNVLCQSKKELSSFRCVLP